MPSPQPLTALPASRVPALADAPPLRWGILSPGGIAALMVDALQANTGQQVVAVGSRSQQRAQAFADRFGIGRAYGSAEELLADPEVDAIYIASPHSEHHRQALAVIEAGKPALVEKAFARNAAEAQQVVDAARAAGVPVMEAMWSRFLPQADVLRQLIADGALGQITSVVADHGQFFEPDAGHRLFNPDLAGGALLDLGIYPISFAAMVLGAPSSVVARGSKAFTGVDGQASMLLEHTGGQDANPVALLDTTLFARTPTTATVSGTLARIEIPGDFYTPNVLRYVHRDGTELFFDGAAADAGGPVEGHRGLAYEAAHFATLVAEGRTESALMPLDETVQILRTIDEVRRQLGVTLPGE